MAHTTNEDVEFECAYCPLMGFDTPVMVDGWEAHPECAEAVKPLSQEERIKVRAMVALGLGNMLKGASD